MFNIKNYAGLKLFLHVGTPKSGSTSFQNALQGAGAEFFIAHRIAYLPDDGSINNSELYKFVVNEDRQSLRNYVYKILEHAVEIGAENVIISAERLFVIDDISRKFQIFSDVCDKISVEFEFILVIRELRNYIRSYIHQLIYNAAIFLDDEHLANWMAGQVMDLVRSGFAVRVLKFEDLVSSGNLPLALLKRMGFSNALLPNRLDNVTPSRPIIAGLAEGALARIEAAMRGIDINSIDMDVYRDEFRKTYDIIAKDDNCFFPKISEIIEDAIAKYIDGSIASMPDDRRCFYDELGGGAELFVPRSLPVIPGDPLLETAARHVRATNWLNKMRKGVHAGKHSQ